MKYQVGDYIKVIRRFDPKADYYNNRPCVVPEMYYLQNNVYRIDHVTRDGNYGVNGWILCDEMIQERVVKIGNDKYVPFSENMEEQK